MTATGRRLTHPGHVHSGTPTSRPTACSRCGADLSGAPCWPLIDPRTILAIEAEAAAQERVRLREEAAGMHERDGHPAIVMRHALLGNYESCDVPKCIWTHYLLADPEPAPAAEP